VKFPIRKAIYSIQFYRDKQGTLNMLETCQGGKLDDWLSMGIFGDHIAKSKLLNKKEKKAFAVFCKGFLQTEKQNLTHP
jgi:hypothetical protein